MDEYVLIIRSWDFTDSLGFRIWNLGFKNMLDIKTLNAIIFSL
jgi:hypothetical protein